MKPKVLSLLNYKKTTKEDYPYLVILHPGALTQKTLFSLSPQVMEFGPYCLICDLRPTTAYWKQQANKFQMDLEGQLLQELQAQWGSDFLAVLCIHPFQGILLSHHLDQSQTRGLMTSESFFTQKIFKNLSWKTWFSTADHFFEFCQQQKIFSKEMKSYPSAKNRLQRLVRRLQLEGPLDLSQAHWTALQRRFSGFLGTLWKWTFFKNTSDVRPPLNLNFFEDLSDLQGFPWRTVEIKEKPYCLQILEFPLATWEQLEPHLRQGLVNLSKNIMLHSPVKITQLQWEITIFDLESYKVTIPFTFPYSLPQDAQKNFKTSLTQLAFAFQNFQEQVQKPSEDLELLSQQLIIGWKLEVSHFIVPREDNEILFSHKTTTAPSNQMVADLQNKITTPMTAFQIRETHIPNLDYREYPLSAPPAETSHAITKNLPLPFFIHPQPLPLESGDFRKTQFIERTSSDWWRSEDFQDTHRDYFLCETKERKLIWAFQNYRGKWFEHGLFS